MKGVEKRLRPGGRTEKNRRAVAEAVLSLIRDGKLDFELQEVANISGVHRSTIFRRWPDRAALIGEAMDSHVSRVSIETTGDLEKDIRNIALGIRDFFSDPMEVAMNKMMAMSDNEVFHRQMGDYWAPILAKYERPIVYAQERGQVSKEIDASMIIEMIVSTLLVATIFTRVPVDDGHVDRLVKQVLILLKSPLQDSVGS